MSAKYAFDPKNSMSAVSETTLRGFLDGELIPDLKSVPGIGEASIKRLAESNVHNTYQLVGIFLALKGPGVGMKDHMEKFFDFLVGVGCKSHHASAAVVAIAARTNTWMPGLYDPAEWD